MRTLLFLSAMLVIAAPALAQPSVGIKAGLTVADVFFDDGAGNDFNTDPRLGVVGGITADVPFTPMLGLRVEALYAQKGYANTIPFTDASGPDPVVAEATITVQLDYLEVPVLLNVRIPMQSSLEIGAQAGVVPAFLIRDGIGCSGFDLEDGTSGCDEIGGGDEDLGLDSFDLGAAAGLTVGAGPFAVDLRYTYGLTNLLGSDPEISSDATAHNGAFSVTGVYRFGR